MVNDDKPVPPTACQIERSAFQAVVNRLADDALLGGPRRFAMPRGVVVTREWHDGVHLNRHTECRRRRNYDPPRTACSCACNDDIAGKRTARVRFRKLEGCKTDDACWIRARR